MGLELLIRRAPDRGGRLLMACAALALVLGSAVSARGEGRPTARHRFPPFRFSLLMFKDWRAVPLDPGARKDDGDLLAPYLVGRFAQIEAEDSLLPRGRGAVFAAPRQSDGTFYPSNLGPQSMAEVLEESLRRFWEEPIKLADLLGKPVKTRDTRDRVLGTFWRVTSSRGWSTAVLGVWRNEDLEVGMWFASPKWDNVPLVAPTPEFEKVIKSLLWIDTPMPAERGLLALKGVNLTAERRREIERGLVRGWDLVVSPSKQYVVVFNTKGGRNANLARLIARRIDAIRTQLYEVQFPPSQPLDDVAVVRVCADVHDYQDYGGLAGTAGYWNRATEELVFYDASPRQALDDDTLAALYHEAFHQYIHYAVGQAPDSWFDEGHGDYYAGARYQNGRFRIQPFRWRVQMIEALLSLPSTAGESLWFRSDLFVRMTQEQYYSLPAINYTQGWGFVYFLREIVPKHPEWPAAWGKILDTYYLTLREEVSRGEGVPDAGEPSVSPEDPATSEERRSRFDNVPDESGIPVGIRRRVASARALAASRKAAFEGVDFAALDAAFFAEMSRLGTGKVRVR